MSHLASNNGKRYHSHDMAPRRLPAVNAAGHRERAGRLVMVELLILIFIHLKNQRLISHTHFNVNELRG